MNLRITPVTMGMTLAQRKSLTQHMCTSVAGTSQLMLWHDASYESDEK